LANGACQSLVVVVVGQLILVHLAAVFPQTCSVTMFRNQYDTDITTYSPQGRLHQVEYAMEAVKQGSAVVGVRSKTHVILATLKRSSSELASHQKKLSQVDDHVGVAIAGLTADARVLSRFMRTECLNHSYTFGTPVPVARLALTVADKCQISTQRASKRPFGVGLLIAGYDSTGPHLYQTCPSGNYFEYISMAIGARSQSSKTYLERSFKEFEECDIEALAKHAILALRESVASAKDTDLTVENTAIAIVGKDTPFTIFEDEAVKPYLACLDEEDAGIATAEGTTMES
jgi:20S proteasome subunit alpha 6